MRRKDPINISDAAFPFLSTYFPNMGVNKIVPIGRNAAALGPFVIQRLSVSLKIKIKAKKAARMKIKDINFPLLSFILEGIMEKLNPKMKKRTKIIIPMKVLLLANS